MARTKRKNKQIGKLNKTLGKRKTQKVFSKKDYASHDGMLTTIWGPSMWHYLHTMSFNYPNKPTAQDKKYYKNSILNLRNVLPCKYCRINLKNNLKIHPLKACHMKNRETFSRYVYNLHEIVNHMLGKKSNLSYDNIRERYEHFRSRCTLNEQKKKIFQFRKTKKKSKKEQGCTEPLYGKKAKCVIKIVPQDTKCETFQMDEKCKKNK
jgi:hypothetical protein